MQSIKTRITEMLNCEVPIIGAPMFLVSNPEMVIAISEAGGVGTFPALNFRPVEEYTKALKLIRESTKKPFGVNIIVNQSNQRATDDLKFALDNGVNVFITSLGSPKKVIQDAHKNGAKVFCDVTNLDHAKKVQDMGADAVIAVGAGAGGHAGPISPVVLIPWLKRELSIPVIAAGGIADGATMASMLVLGAEAVSVGTRFIASTEAKVEQDYKEAIVKSTPEDIVMTKRLSGTPAAVINTEFIKKTGTDLPMVLEFLQKKSKTKKLATILIHYLGMRQLEEAAGKVTWKQVWSAGQTVGLIHDIKPCKQIVEDMVKEYFECIKNLTGK
jgi:nitronate monooxygenase